MTSCVSWLIAVVAAAAVAGCADTLPQTGEPTGLKSTATVRPTTKPVRMVALRPIAGPPAAVSERIVRAMNEAASNQNVALIVDPTIDAPTALSGVVVADTSRASTRFTFVWDLIDASGKRIDRISGEESFPSGSASGDVWDSVPPAALKTMTDKVLASLAAAPPN
jgi:hypothetical protein